MAVLGVSGSGKTTFIEQIVRTLSSEGYKVGTIKHVHHKGFSMDTEGKDTWKHSRAGAEVVVCVSPNEIAKIKRKTQSEDDLKKAFDAFKDEDLDLLIVEGFRSLTSNRRGILKIVTAKNETNLKQVFEEAGEPIIAITGLIASSSTRHLGSSYESIPVIDMERNDTRMLNLVKTHLRNWNAKNDRIMSMP
ncbi:MAG: molybdopterin-guanine dinucleotide biosynthesis protein B [Promethearchaeota archaeon]